MKSTMPLIFGQLKSKSDIYNNKILTIRILQNIVCSDSSILENLNNSTIDTFNIVFRYLVVKKNVL